MDARPRARGAFAGAPALAAGAVLMAALPQCAAVSLWLAVSRPMAAQDVAAQDAAPSLDNTLAQFPASDLPALLRDLAASEDTRDDAVLDQLAALGPTAHEALLGYVLQRRQGYRPALARAFGGFDAGSARWLPVLLAEDRRLHDPVVQTLLGRLGHAAAPALAELRARRDIPESVVRALTAATDAAPPAMSPPLPPLVAPQLRSAVLHTLRVGPAAQRWPALQAALALDDDAAEAAVCVLLDLEGDATAAESARALRFVVACVYRTRSLVAGDLTTAILQQVPANDLPREVRRYVLAGGGLVQAEFRAFLAHDSPVLRRAALLSAALDDGRLPAAEVERVLPTLRADADHSVGTVLASVLEHRRRVGAARAGTLVDDLRSDDPARRQRALRQLSTLDLHATSLSVADALLACAVRESRGDFAAAEALARMPALAELAEQRRSYATPAERRVLLRALARVRPLPAVALAMVVQIDTFAEPDLERAVLEVGEVRDIATLLRAELAQGAQRLLARAVVREATRVGRDALALLAPDVQALWPGLTAGEQLQCIDAVHGLSVPSAAWGRLVQDSDVDVRRRAARAWARRAADEAPDDPAWILPLLDDAEAKAVDAAASLLARVRRGQVDAVAALRARWERAAAEQRVTFAATFVALAAHAEAAADVMAAALSESAPVELQALAAQFFLARDPVHVDGLAVLARLLHDSRVSVRQAALWRFANHARSATPAVDRALVLLDDEDPYVRHWAARLLSVVPSAKERSLPALRRRLVVEPAETMLARSGAQFVQRLEEAR